MLAVSSRGERMRAEPAVCSTALLGDISGSTTPYQPKPLANHRRILIECATQLGGDALEVFAVRSLPPGQSAVSFALSGSERRVDRLEWDVPYLGQLDD